MGMRSLRRFIVVGSMIGVMVLAACGVSGETPEPEPTRAVGATATTAAVRDLVNYLPTSATLPPNFLTQPVTSLLPREVANTWPDPFTASQQLVTLGLLETQQLIAWINPAVATPVSASDDEVPLQSVTVLAMRWERTRGAADSVVRHADAMLTSPFGALQALDDTALPVGIFGVEGELTGGQPLYATFIWRTIDTVTVFYSGFSSSAPPTAALLEVATADIAAP